MNKELMDIISKVGISNFCIVGTKEAIESMHAIMDNINTVIVPDSELIDSSMVYIIPTEDKPIKIVCE